MSMNSKVTVFLRGGLGNQMFQCAVGLNLAKKNNAQLLLDTTFLNDRFPRSQFTYRSYDLDIFRIEPHFTTLSKISSTIPIPGVWLGLDLALIKMRDILGIQRIIKEKKEYRFDPQVFSAKGNIVLYGRWQSEKYFADITRDIRNTFCFKEKLSGDAAAFAKQIQNSNSVSLYVRRGDYVKFEKMKKIMGDTDLSYYVRAVSYIAERVPAPHFFILSDDIAWCRENIKIPFPAMYLDEKIAGSKYAFYLELMSLCKHNIIANGTFSWWGAWLNENPGKIIIAPKKWHAGENFEMTDIIPQAWIRM